jgi:NitT/TauT family transport system substrate-binding protein
MEQFMNQIRGGVIAAIAVAALVLHSLAANAADKTKLVAETDWTPHGMIAGLMLAKQKGWFDAAGLDVNVLDGKGSTTTIQQLAAGQIDIGFAQLSTMAAAVGNGLPVISIMGIVQAGDAGIAVPVNSGWNTLRDIKGKRILVASGSGTAPYLDAFLKAGGLSRSDVTVINCDITAQVPTYIQGGADGALQLAFDFLPLVSKDRPSKMILFSSVGLRVPSFGLIVRKDSLDKKAEALKKFVQVEQRAWIYIVAGHEQEAIDAIVAQRSGQRLDPAVLLAQLKAEMPYFTTAATKGKPTGYQAVSDWQSTIKTMQGAGVLKSSLDPSNMFTNRFISDQFVLK